MKTLMDEFSLANPGVQSVAKPLPPVTFASLTPFSPLAIIRCLYRSALGLRLGRTDVFSGLGVRQQRAPVWLPHAFAGTSVELSRPGR